MDKETGVRLLYRWFGNHEFQVNNIDDPKIRTLAKYFDLGASTINGKRTQLGRVLSGMDGHYCPIGFNRVGTLVVVEPADDSASAAYQIQLKEGN